MHSEQLHALRVTGRLDQLAGSIPQRIAANAVSAALESALRGGRRDEVVQLLREHAPLLHLPVRSGNWGPPMSFAANLGDLDVVQAIAALGARDHQHAFDRALLRGNIDCARWLYEHGATVSPDSVLGTCETLCPAGLHLLVELAAPLTDRHGNRLAPLAMVLQTYSRAPAQKREMTDPSMRRWLVRSDRAAARGCDRRVGRAREVHFDRACKGDAERGRVCGA